MGGEAAEERYCTSVSPGIGFGRVSEGVWDQAMYTCDLNAGHKMMHSHEEGRGNVPEFVIRWPIRKDEQL